MSRNRLPYIAGAVLGVGVLYFYKAGGNADAARLKAEADAHRVSAGVKSHLPGRGDAEKKLANFGEKAGAKIDEVVSATEADTRQTIDRFDEKVLKGTSEVKKSVSGWFGSGK